MNAEAQPGDPDCPVCPDGHGELLGQLGHTDHYRCRQCGFTFSVSPIADAEALIASRAEAMPPAHQAGIVRAWAWYVALQDRTFTTAQVSGALNRAADDIMDAADVMEPVRDAINLLVNTTLTYLGDPDADLADAIKANYQIEPDATGPVDWIGENS